MRYLACAAAWLVLGAFELITMPTDLKSEKLLYKGILLRVIAGVIAFVLTFIITASYLVTQLHRHFVPDNLVAALYISVIWSYIPYGIYFALWYVRQPIPAWDGRNYSKIP